MNDDAPLILGCSYSYRHSTSGPRTTPWDAGKVSCGAQCFDYLGELENLNNVEALEAWPCTYEMAGGALNLDQGFE
jgi:hypothetical protein